MSVASVRRFDEVRGRIVARPPELGEQTEEVLAESGFTADEIGTPKQNKVV